MIYLANSERRTARRAGRARRFRWLYFFCYRGWSDWYDTPVCRARRPPNGLILDWPVTAEMPVFAGSSVARSGLR